MDNVSRKLSENERKVKEQGWKVVQNQENVLNAWDEVRRLIG